MEPTRKRPKHESEKKVVNFKYSIERLALLDTVLKRNNTDRTTFITKLIDSAIEEMLLDRKDFFLNNQDFETFEKILNAPPRDIKALKALFKEKAPWEK